jgi:hypothetical protein
LQSQVFLLQIREKIALFKFHIENLKNINGILSGLNGKLDQVQARYVQQVPCYYFKLTQINKEERKYDRMRDPEFEKYSNYLRSLKRLKIECSEFQKVDSLWGMHENGKDAVKGFYNHVNDCLEKCFED